MTTLQVTLAALAVGCVLGIPLEYLAAWSLRVGDQGQPDPLPRRLWATCLASGLACAAMVVIVGVGPTLPAWWAYALGGVAISRTDLARHRIPDVLALGTLAVGAALLFYASMQQGASDAYLRAWIAAAASFAVFLLLSIGGKTGLGMGDVKLAPTLGLYLGYYGWTDLVLGLFAGFVLGAVVGLFIVVAVRARGGKATEALRRAIPFGPFLLVGALLPIALA